MKAYYPMTLHVHSIWERQASMEGHFYNAQKLGIQHMYITDHDNRMGPRANHVDHFDFTKGVLKVLEPSKDPLRPRWYGFTVEQHDEGTSVAMKDGAMHLEASSTEVGKGKWSTINVLFDSSQKRHEVALLAKAMLHLGMQITDYSDCSKDIRIIIDVKLSQRPPEFENAHIYYVFGNTEGLESPYITVKSMDEYQAFNCFDFDLLTDAEEASLTEKMEAFCDEYEMEIAVVTINYLAGKTATAETGSAGATYAKSVTTKELVGKTSQMDTFTEVATGAVQFAVVDVLLAENIVGKGNFTNLKIVDTIDIDKEVYSIGCKKNSDFDEKINEALVELLNDGTLEALATKYNVHITDTLMAKKTAK